MYIYMLVINWLKQKHPYIIRWIVSQIKKNNKWNELIFFSKWILQRWIWTKLVYKFPKSFTLSVFYCIAFIPGHAFQVNHWPLQVSILNNCFYGVYIRELNNIKNYKRLSVHLLEKNLLNELNDILIHV